MTKTINYFIILVIVSIVTSCSQKNPEAQLQLLNGYWEIAQIENSYGSSKEYSISQNIDFFEVTTNRKGVRKKVQPDLSGNFTTSNSSQNIDVIIEGNTLFLEYSTEFDTWQEEVIKVTSRQLILKNTDNYTYTYRRYEPLTTN